MNLKGESEVFILFLFKDIINVCFFITKSVRVINDLENSEGIQYLPLEKLKNQYENNFKIFVPNFSLSQYKTFK